MSNDRDLEDKKLEDKKSEAKGAVVSSSKPKKYMMSVQEFIRRLEDVDDPDQKAFIQIVANGRGAAQSELKFHQERGADLSRIFNGYENITFVSEDFHNKFVESVKQFISIIKSVSKQEQEVLLEPPNGKKNLNTVSPKTIKKIQTATKEIYGLIIDYACEEFLDSTTGKVKRDIASTLFETDEETKQQVINTEKNNAKYEILNTHLDSFILSARENISGDLFDFVENTILTEAELEKSEIKQVKEIDKAIQIYLKPRPTKEIYDFIIQNNGLNNLKQNLESASDEVKLFFSLAYYDSWRVDIEARFNEAKNDVQKEKILKNQYAKFCVDESERQAAIVFLQSQISPSEWGSILELESLRQKYHENKHTIENVVEQKKELIRNAINQNLFQRYKKYSDLREKISRLAGWAIAEFRTDFGSREGYEIHFAKQRIDNYKDKCGISFTAGLTSWKKYAFWGGLALLAVAACVVTLGAALPAVAAISAPLIGAGTFTGYTGFMGMASATISNSYLGRKYNGLTTLQKVGVVCLLAALVIGVSIATGGAAVGVFVGGGFVVGITAMASPHVLGGLGSTAALGVTSGAKSLSVPLVAAGAHKRLSSSATLSQKLSGDGSGRVVTESVEEKLPKRNEQKPEEGDLLSASGIPPTSDPIQQPQDNLLSARNDNNSTVTADSLLPRSPSPRS